MIMTKIINTHPFNIHSLEKDAVALRDYTSNVDSLSYKRIAPKRQKDFPGMEKSEVKTSVTNPITGEFIGIVVTSTSIRADSVDAAKNSLMATHAAALADASWSDLVLDQRLPTTA